MCISGVLCARARGPWRERDLRVFRKEEQRRKACTPVIKAHGGKVLARGPGAERHEGSVEGIVMMIEFESIDSARTFYLSDEYQAAKAVRDACAETDLMIIEGTD